MLQIWLRLELKTAVKCFALVKLLKDNDSRTLFNKNATGSFRGGGGVVLSVKLGGGVQ